MSVAVLVASVTTWLSTTDVLRKLFASPSYTAVSGYVSAFRADRVSVAMPLALSVAVPMESPQVKFTFPVGGNRGGEGDGLTCD